MPIYIFSHPVSGETIEVVQSVNDEHVYIDSNGVSWNRIFTVPTASTNTQIDALSASDFVNKTSNKKETLGDIFDRSKEASEKRKEKMGHDPIKKKYWEDWSKKRKGRKHPDSFKD